MSEAAAKLISEALNAETVAVILRNVRRELTELQVETAQRRSGRYNPTADAQAALSGVERLAVCLEALTEIVERKLTNGV